MSEEKFSLKDVAGAIKDGRIVSAFSGEPYYDPDSDSIFHFRKETAYKATRVDGFLTIFRSRKTNQVIGIQLKNAGKVAAAIERRTGHKLDRQTKLELLVDEVIQNEYMDWDSQVAPHIYYTLQVDGFYLTYIPRRLVERAAA